MPYTDPEIRRAYKAGHQQGIADAAAGNDGPPSRYVDPASPWNSLAVNRRSPLATSGLKISVPITSLLPGPPTRELLRESVNCCKLTLNVATKPR